MQSGMNVLSPQASPCHYRFSLRAWGLLAVLAVIIAPHPFAGQSIPEPISAPPRPTGVLLPEANRIPDANAQMEMREKNAKQQDFAAANAERKKQIADDTEKLLKLANDLKAEVDKSNKDTLSLSVIRKADEIERLAHVVKEKMKLSVGGS
jgi:hypothetical protein